MVSEEFVLRSLNASPLIKPFSRAYCKLLGSFFAKMRAFTRFLFVVLVAKFEFAGFRKQKKYRAYDRFHGNGPYGKIPTKKEPIRMQVFTSRLSCHIINLS